MLRAAGGGIGVASGIQVLARSTAAASCPADTTEDTLATIMVPANAMGPNGVLMIHTRWTYTNSANSKTMKVKYSGAAGTAYHFAVATANAGATFITEIANTGVTNSQKGPSILEGTTGFSASPLVTSSVDTTVATTIVISGQKAVAGDALTLESYRVEVMYGA